jgi:hypothetical protein
MNFPARKPNSGSYANGPPYATSGRIVGHPDVGWPPSKERASPLVTPSEISTGSISQIQTNG